MKSKPAAPKAATDIEAAGRRALDGGHFRDAIAAFKDLLKRERRPEWGDALAEAYLGRAREVARKGMFQEAALLWENQAKYRPELRPTAEYLGWLLHAGQVARLGQALAAASESLAETATGRRLLEALALQALGDSKLVQALPREHVIARQQPALCKAIEAYAAGRDAELDECLKPVSSRSPYRNLRLLLKGLQRLPGDPAGAAETWQRIEPDSICRKLALTLSATGAAGPLDLEGYLALPPRQRALVDRLRGFGKAQLALLKDLAKAAGAGAPRPLLEAVLRHRGELGERTARRAAIALLVACPDALPLYERAFGELSAFEGQRLLALYAEQQQDYPTASRHWHQCIDLLEAREAGEREPLTQALIYRHVAELAELPVPALAVDCLEKSLEKDPEDKASYIKLMDLMDRVEDEPREAQAWLERALKQFPEDPEVLLRAAQSARRRKAYKKAAGYARALLANDPINAQARCILLESHLGHARKLLKSQRFDAAARELAEAARLDPQCRNAALRYGEGLLAYFQADNEACRRLWREAAALSGGGLPAAFQWAIEVKSVGLPLSGPAALFSKPDKKHQAGSAELAALSRLLGQYAAEGPSAIGAALKPLVPMLRRSFKQPDFGTDEGFALCQGFADVGQWEILAECAAKFLKGRWPPPPAFVYFDVLARCRGRAESLGERDEYRLNDALAVAMQGRDRRAAGLIERFLAAFEEALNPAVGDLTQEELASLGKVDRGTIEKLVVRLSGLNGLSPEEQVEEILKDMDRGELRGLSESELQERMVARLLEEIGLDPEKLLPLLPQPGRKPKRKR